MLYQDELIESIEKRDFHRFSEISEKIIDLSKKNIIEDYVEALLLKLGFTFIDKEFENNEFLQSLLSFNDRLILCLAENDREYYRELFQLNEILTKNEVLTPLHQVFLKNLVQLNRGIIVLLKPNYLSFLKIIWTRKTFKHNRDAETSRDIILEKNLQRFIKILNEHEKPLKSLYINLKINFLGLNCLAYTHVGAEKAVLILSEDRNQALLKQLIDDGLKASSLSHLLNSSLRGIDEKISTLLEKAEDFKKLRRSGLDYPCICNILSKSSALGTSIDDFNDRIDQGKVEKIIELLKLQTKNNKIKRCGISYFLMGSGVKIGENIDKTLDLLGSRYINFLMKEGLCFFSNSNYVIYKELVMKIDLATQLNVNDMENLCFNSETLQFYLFYILDFNAVTDKFCKIREGLGLLNEDMVSMLRGSGCNIAHNITRLYPFVCIASMRKHIKRIFLESGPDFFKKIKFFISILDRLRYLSTNQWDCLSHLMRRCTGREMASIMDNTFGNDLRFRMVMDIYQAFTELEDNENKKQRWESFVKYMRLSHESEDVNKTLINTLVDTLVTLNQSINLMVSNSYDFFKLTETFQHNFAIPKEYFFSVNNAIHDPQHSPAKRPNLGLSN